MINQNKFFNIPGNIDAPLWRYIDTKKLESLLETGCLHFTRSDLLGDEHEGSTTKLTIEERKNFYRGASEHTIKFGFPKLGKDWGKCTYISCWHCSKNESLAMWELYLPIKNGSNGVAIKTSISRLKKYIIETERDFYLNPVQYLDYDTDTVSEGNAFIPFFIKRDIHQHEREFRILVANLEDLPAVSAGTKDPIRGIFIPVILDKLIEKIIISPFANPATVIYIERLLKKYHLEEKLEDSTTKRTPEF
ncbi:hypothetical protein KBB49_00465 [Candidatus Saccharibacteria bacterium]|jgi:hypothetical protein|nr:hypothetical protein [Candidatus Saccharibacteria bacterium]